MTKSELAVKIAESTRYPKQEVSEIINSLLNEITCSMLSGKKIVITNFGTFSSRTTPSRQVYNFQTGKVMTMGKRTIPTFKMSKTLVRDFVKLKK